MGSEQNIREIVRQAGYSVSNNELKLLIKEFNNYQNPISICLIKILENPKDFLEFLSNKQSL